MKRFLKPMISHYKFRVLSLNENIVKSTLTEIFCAIVFALDLNSFNYSPNCNLTFSFLVQFPATLPGHYLTNSFKVRFN